MEKIIVNDRNNVIMLWSDNDKKTNAVFACKTRGGQNKIEINDSIAAVWPILKRLFTFRAKNIEAVYSRKDYSHVYHAKIRGWPDMGQRVNLWKKFECNYTVWLEV